MTINLKEIFAWVKSTVFVLLVSVAILGGMFAPVYYLVPECHTETIPYSTEIRHQSKARSSYNPEKEVVQQGEDGEAKYCKNRLEQDYTKTVTTEPTTEIITEWYYYDLNPTPIYNSFNTYQTAPASDGVRTGAVCNDGTTSQATGRGACSRHGGVNYWLTN